MALKTEMVLLGAGASVEAGVPTSFQMTEKIAEILRREKDHARQAHLVSFVIGGLLFQRGIRGDDPFVGVDVEELFSAVQLLANRHTLEAAPFIGSWHAMIDEFDKVTGSFPGSLDNLYRAIYRSVSGQITDALTLRPSRLTREQIDNELTEVIRDIRQSDTRWLGGYTFRSVSGAIDGYVEELTQKWTSRLQKANPQADSKFRKEFSHAVQSQQARPGAGQIFQETASLLTQTLKELVLIHDPALVTYLAPLLDIINVQGQLTIATLNYDNSIEVLCNSRDVTCQTGIDNWSEDGDFEICRRGVNLLKLHGSIDWALEPGQVKPGRPMPHSTIRRVDHNQIAHEDFQPSIIFGQRNKLTAEGPFLDLLRAFRRSLSHAHRLTVIGYSFRDSHINEYISQWLNGSVHRRLRIISPSFNDSSVLFAEMLRDHAGDRLEIIPNKAGVGLRNLT